MITISAVIGDKAFFFYKQLLIFLKSMGLYIRKNKAPGGGNYDLKRNINHSQSRENLPSMLFD
jgi:hypothetical protein